MSPDPSTKGPQRTVQMGKYRVTAHLATGGMGAVYKAYDTEAKRDVALKVLAPEMAAKPIMIERFRREAKHAAKLRHENIVQVYDFGDADGCYYIAMEFIEGIDLNEYVERKGPLDPEEALNLVTQATKALAHAHRQGIIHRDIKPSNFLVTRRKGRLVVKLTDLGLSREAQAEEFRVTRAGTTVGTVDYISPEQARDSGTADIRSDLYSLGCTWFHLLAGKAPFAEGGLAERLHKHLNVEPPDVRSANPRVSRATVAVLRRLLAKRPADRYQTPAELLKDLGPLADGGAPTGRRALLLGLLDGDDARPAAPTTTLPSSKTGVDRRARRSSAGKGRTTDPARRKAGRPVRLWYVLGGAAAALLIAGVAAAVLWQHLHQPAPNSDLESNNTPSAAVPPGPAGSPSAANPDSGDPKPPVKPSDQAPDKPPPKTVWPVLDPTAKKVDAAELRQTIEQPWAGQFQRPADALVLHVVRAPTGGPGAVYPTLAAAAAAAPPGRLSVVEIDDDGPLFETSATFSDRSLIICAGAGFRPLIVWDVQRCPADWAAAGKPALLSVARGGLRLENLDVVYAPRDAAGGLALLDLRDANLWADGCTFSLAGKPHEGTVLARIHGTRPDSALCRFSRCYVRGPAVTAVDVDAPGASVLFDRSLIVGGDSPLIQVRANDVRATRLTVVRSTLVCGRTILNVQRAGDADHKPAVAWLGWDCLLSRSSDQVGGDMIRAPTGDGVSADGIQWRAVNCLYAGWKNLLTGPDVMASTDMSGWHAHWVPAAGDATVRDLWPTYSEDPSVLPAGVYRTAATPVGFAASAAPDGPLGCDLSELPPTRDEWRWLTAESFLMPPFNQITSDAAPVVNPPADNLYHGGSIDLNQPNVDLGAILRKLKEQHRLAPRVVLVLSGAGEHPITPFHLQGCTLVLYADPPKEDAAPLTLTWAGQGSVGQDGLIEIEDGGLDLINVNLKLADFLLAAEPEYAVKVRGQLRLFHCRLEGPRQNVSDAYSGLIDLEGSGDPAPAAACASAINECVLVSGRDGVRLHGVGAWLLLRQSVLVAGRDALHLDPGPNGAGRANAQCVLDHATIAAHRSVVHLEDIPSPLDPLPRGAKLATEAPVPSGERGRGEGAAVDPFVVRSRYCAFLDPFSEKSSASGLLCFEKSALAHGLLVWQGDGDAFGKRLSFAAALALPPASALLDPLDKEVRPAWTRLWGSYGDGHPAPDVTQPKLFDAAAWPLDRLALPKPRDGSAPDKNAPGADLAALGLLKKPAKPH